jgi:ABC-type nitrate/sulfonate/bicarbonate transport system permease component
VTAATLGSRLTERLGGRRGESGGRRIPWSTFGIGVVAWVGVIGAWELLARTSLEGTHLIGTPSGMWSATVDNAALYGRALRTTLGEAAWGFLWGNLAAVALATMVAMAPATERLVLRLSLVFYCLPLVAVGPVLRVIFGFSSGPQIPLRALAVFYTTLVPLLVGLRAIPAGWSELVASYGRGRFTALVVVRARASVPYLAAGLQVAVPAAFLGALVGEFTGAERGMGILIIHALRSLDTDGLWALAAISAVTSVVGYVLAGALGRRLTVGQPPVLMAAPPSGAPAPARRRLVRGAAEIAATAVLVLLVWEGFIRGFDLNNFFAKGPADVWAWLVTDPDAAANRSEILDALRETAVVAVPGYVAGLVLGAALAALFDLSASVRRKVTPFTVALRCVPIVAIAPLLVRALGRGGFGPVVTVALWSFFPTLVACAQGLRQAPGQVMDFFATYDVGPARTLWSAQVPAMMPAFFAAARIAVPASILAATVAEWLATGTGMGNLMALSAGNNVYGTLWSAVVVLTSLAALAYGFVAFIERLVLARVAPEQSTW